MNMMLPRVRQGTSAANNRAESNNNSVNHIAINRESSVGIMKDGTNSAKMFSNVAIPTPSHQKHNMMIGSPSNNINGDQLAALSVYTPNS